ncbi:spondin domain-containing protein [Cyclobacterium sp. 1_MG-2023]|uniref:spondin domain-containing protein n=1 Tax=Cyclobacterium sp. 1_MG-2023 TaxID=3062681 RepID=UPI0026E205EE|nr:spondin domain-containing protein [Cyclobacterium sp. 1_MG-2023]MDO6437794.1 spondin domain-containing protein [Cyclobacterium sp. 1_MG-2023]
MKNVRLFSFSAIFASILMLNGCDTKDDEMPETMNSTFTVTIENIFEAKEYFNTGQTGLITPGNTESFSFDAGVGQSVSFATMLVESNDLFYAPDEMGISLYDDNGDPITGDVSDMISLWDAGTEVNETPGMGANQPLRQSGANTGTTENNPVQMVDDNFTYPSSNAILKVEIEHDGGTLFTLTLSNVSNSSTLPSPLAPGIWVIHETNQMPIFTDGTLAKEGLEPLAEDGDNVLFNTNLVEMTGFFSPLAPGAYAIGSENMIFMTGQSSSTALEKLAEDGDASGFESVFNTPVGAASAGPLLPDNSYSFTFTADNGDKLSFATMLVQSNDWFIGTDNLDLFTNGMPISGDITTNVYLYDTGTEIDEYAGAGKNQPLRQSGPNTGVDEGGNISLEANPSENIPSLDKMVRVTITPM